MISQIRIFQYVRWLLMKVLFLFEQEHLGTVQTLKPLILLTQLHKLELNAFRPIAQIAGWNVLQSLMCTGDLSDSNV
jgi:hypothetical protein